MAKTKPRYCWDTSIFLAWFKNEPISETPGMRAVIDEITSKRAILVVPVTVYTEILEHHNSPDVMKAFRDFLKRSNIQVVNITMGLAEKAESIRTKGERERKARKIKTPDALYLACAIKAEVDMLHSADKDMLQLNGHATVDGLKICHPRTVSGDQSLC
jgi:predicted nucleic acid-binding protein